MFPPSPDGPGQQDPAAAAKAPLPPVGRLPRGGSSAPPRGDFLKSMVSGLAPVERGVNMIREGLKVVRSAGVLAPQILDQFDAMTGFLLPLALQQTMVPGRADQGSMPPSLGQAGITPAGPGMGAMGPGPGPAPPGGIQ